MFSDRRQISAENCIMHPEHCQKLFSKILEIVHDIKALIQLSQFDVKTDFLNLFLTVK